LGNKTTVFFVALVAGVDPLPRHLNSVCHDTVVTFLNLYFSFLSLPLPFHPALTNDWNVNKDYSLLSYDAV
jgi:hypothetical protein